MGRGRWNREFRGGEVKWSMSGAVFKAWDYCPFVCSELTQSLSPCKTHSHHLPHTVADILIKLTEAWKYTAAISWLTGRGV